VIYFGLLAVFLGVLTEIFLSVLDVQSESLATSVVAQDSQYLLSRISYDLHRAQSIVYPPLGQTNSTLRLQIDGDVEEYRLNNNSLVLNDQPLNHYQTKISNLTFSHLGNGSGKDDSVKIEFTLEGVVLKRSGVENQNLETVITLRNL
jgi:hypothetical protein